MRPKAKFGFILLMGSCLLAAGKDKKKPILPADVLEARTVLVVIDPDAGVPLDAPNTNVKARDAVERALMNWGRFSLATDVSTADLVISVRKSNGKIAQPTIGGVPTNNRPGVYQPTDSGGRVGLSRGTPPQAGDPTGDPGSRPHPQVEAGNGDDIFAVYRGKRDNALDAPALWRYRDRDALRSPDLPAVDAFRKAIVEAEKQRAANP